MRRRHTSSLPNRMLLLLLTVPAPTSLPKISVRCVKSKSVHWRMSKLARAVTVRVEPSQMRVTGGKDWNHCIGPPPPAAPPLASKKLLFILIAK